MFCIYPSCFYLRGFFIGKNKASLSNKEALLKTLSALLLLENNVSEGTENEQVVHILTTQESVGVFDVQKSFHIKNGFITKGIYKNSKATNIFIPVTLQRQ